MSVCVPVSVCVRLGAIERESDRERERKRKENKNSVRFQIKNRDIFLLEARV